MLPRVGLFTAFARLAALAFGFSLTAALTLGGTWGAGSSQAAITLGGDLGTEPNAGVGCSVVGSTRGCLAVDDFLPGRVLVVPPGMTGVIDRWNIRLGDATTAQSIRIRVVRRLTFNTFTVLSSGPLHDVPAGAGMYSFAEQLPISAGDQVGVEAGQGTPIESIAPLTGANSFDFSPLPDAAVATGPPTITHPNQQHTFNAEFDPTNTFTLGAITRNKRKGTATVTVENLLNPGELAVSGDGVNASSAALAEISKVVNPGPAQLLVKATGKKKKRLNQKGKVTLNVAVTYTPTDGDANSQSIRVKLKKKL